MLRPHLIQQFFCLLLILFFSGCPDDDIPHSSDLTDDTQTIQDSGDTFDNPDPTQDPVTHTSQDPTVDSPIDTPEDNPPEDILPDDTIQPEDTQDTTADQETDTVVRPPCGTRTFSYDAGNTNIQSAVVAGSFNGWASTPSEGGWEMINSEQASLWTVTRILEPGDYEYKFVIDGEWIPDPSNPNQVSDGYGGYNSTLHIECTVSEVHLIVVSHHSDQSGLIRAEVRLEPSDLQLDPQSIHATLDRQDVLGSTSVEGNNILLEIPSVGTGIHDLRLQASSTDGGRTPMILLKFYTNIPTDWNNVLLYFVMTDRFRNGDTSNDRQLEVEWTLNWQGGDLRGITQAIESGYFDDLGVSGLWISWPIDNYDGYHEGGRPSEHRCGLNPANTGTVSTRYTGFHGYWPRHLDQVDSHFGTMADLETMVDSAHAHGIRILLDFTANHVHESSPLFNEHRDYFNWPDNGGDHICNNVGWDTEPETCWFTDFLPDLNYTNPEATRAISNMAIDWIKKTGADGFHFDALKHINRSFVRHLRNQLAEEIELTSVDFYMVGETFSGDTQLISSYIGPDQVHGQFDFPTNLQVLKAFATRSIGLDVLDREVRRIKGIYGSGLMSNFIGNHDIARFLSMAAGDIYCPEWDVNSNIAQGWLYPPDQPDEDLPYRYLRLAFVYITTIPGIPLVYYGDEFGMPGAGDPDNRRMMRFDQELNNREQETLQFMQRLGTTRALHSSLRTGSWGSTLASDTDTLVFFRQSSDDLTLIILNRSLAPQTISFNLSELGITDGARLTDALTPGSRPITVSDGQVSLQLEGTSAAILVRE